MSWLPSCQAVACSLPLTITLQQYEQASACMAPHDGQQEYSYSTLLQARRRGLVGPAGKVCKLPALHAHPLAHMMDMHVTFPAD